MNLPTYEPDFKEDAEAYKVLYSQTWEELRTQQEINKSLANENLRLREELRKLKNETVPAINRGTITTNRIRTENYEPGDDPYRFYGDGRHSQATPKMNVYYDGSPPLQEKDADGYALFKLDPIFTCSG